MGWLRRKRGGKFSDIGLRLALQLGGMEDLHFGYWDGIEVRQENVGRAQRRYSEMLASHIPEGVRSILDVGCGAGNFALFLCDRGYRVECLAPDPVLVEKARERLGSRAEVHVSTFEDFETDRRYDLILMSESCQYVKSRAGLAQAARLLNPGGRLLAADVFRHRSVPRDKPHIGSSGHHIERFLDTAAKNGLRLEEKVDITEQVGPTLELYDQLLRTKVIPIAEAAVEAFQRSNPILFRLVRWFLGGTGAFLREKYRHQGLGTFRQYKSYLVLRFRKVP